jgi:hypothetical protein
VGRTTIDAAGEIETFLVLLIGIGPKLALVPFLEITASVDAATKRRVLRKMLIMVALALALILLGEPLRTLLHFSLAALSIAGGVILLVLAVSMVLGQSDDGASHTAGKDPMQLAQFPLAVPYLLNPVAIVGLVTSPTTSPDPYSNPADSDPDYTPDCEEPGSGAYGIRPVANDGSKLSIFSQRQRRAPSGTRSSFVFAPIAHLHDQGVATTS